MLVELPILSIINCCLKNSFTGIFIFHFVYFVLMFILKYFIIVKVELIFE